MAAALHLADSPIIFAPVLRGYTITLLIYGLSFYRVLDILIFTFTYKLLWLYYVVSLPVQIATGWWALHMARQYARDRTAMRSQLAGFRCEDTNCFCCTVDHMLPGTGTVISCDRQAIYIAINHWFKGGLPELENKVHEMEPVVEAGLGYAVMGYTGLFHCLLPSFWQHVSVQGVEACGHWADMLSFVVMGIMNCSLDLLLFSGFMRLASITQRKPRWCCDWGYTLLCAILWMALYTGWYQVYFVVVMDGGTYSLHAFYIGVNLIVSWLWMTGASQVRRCCRRAKGQGPRAKSQVNACLD